MLKTSINLIPTKYNELGFKSCMTIKKVKETGIVSFLTALKKIRAAYKCLSNLSIFVK
jgi:hypothetical protein